MSELYEPRAGGLPRMLAELEHVCRDAGYAFTLIDSASQQLVCVGHDGLSFFAGIGRIQNYPLNSATAASIARDKAFTYQTLAAAGLSVPPYGVFFLDPSRARLRGPGRERSDGASYARSLGYPVFVKPIDGAQGALAGPAFDDADLDQALDAIAERHHAALIQPVFTGAEWRLFMLDGQARFAYRRESPALIGDGVHTIAELLSRRRARVEGLGVGLPSIMSPALQASLRARELTEESLLPVGERLTFVGAANLSLGGAIADFTERPRDDWCAWGRAILDALALRVGAIDFFVTDHGLIVLEVNHTPDLAGIVAAGHGACARGIWRDVLGLYFAEAAARRR